LNAPLDDLKGIFDLRDCVNKPFFPVFFQKLNSIL
jgi:hypothetical protein